jgi:surface polysaccharide O-acyltransferase-like enzyme
VDWIRTLALGLLIVYHSAVAFQPWGLYLGFIQNQRPLPGLWRLMELINIWRIPILFVVSGMGLRFAMQRRSWAQLLGDRTLRILLPLVFGSLTVGPLFGTIGIHYYYGRTVYYPNPAHLWFLGNIFLYVLLMLPVVIWVKRRPGNALVRGVERILRSGNGVGIFALAIPTILEAVLVNPADYATYANTLHGLVLGLLCFALGFLFISTGETGRRSAERMRVPALAFGIGLYVARQVGLWAAPNALIAFESMSWMIAIWGFASRHLDRPSRALRYLSSAVYPVYIVHMPMQALVSLLLIPWGIHPLPKFLLLVLLTLAGSLALYEILKRIRWIRPLFGMKWTRHRSPRSKTVRG